MATDVMESAEVTAPAKAVEQRVKDRECYLFTAEQALKMGELGIISEDEHVELLDGVFYRMTRHELHTFIVGTLDDLIRLLIPAEYHVRQEKPARRDDLSIPEPDFAVCRGPRKHYLPNLPTLENLALVVEVCHTTAKADRVTKFAFYAVAGIPCYWIVNVDDRSVAVWTDPAKAKDGSAVYRTLVTYLPGQSIPVVIDGQPRGEINVADIFPPEVNA